MIILDTNVLSELAHTTPDERVLSCLDSLRTDDLATTTVTAAELWYGVALLPEGRRKTRLANAIDVLLSDMLRGRVEAFDVSAASHYARIAADRTRRGHPIGTPDGQIAAICHTRGATLATRNIKDFRDTGIELIDPWNAG